MRSAHGGVAFGLLGPDRLDERKKRGWVHVVGADKTRAAD